jgi:hypothetical protein
VLIEAAFGVPDGHKPISGIAIGHHAEPARQRSS